MASQITAETVSSPDSLSDLWCLFIHLNTCYQTLLNGITAHICHSQLHTTNNRKMQPWVLAHHSFVICALLHRVAKS
jgi:hypothetical protein